MSKHPLMLDDRDWDRDKVMEHICDILATSSKGIGTILSEGYQGLNLPSYSTIMKWLEEDVALSDRYAKGKEAQAEYMADEIISIADDGQNDYMQQLDKEGKVEWWKYNGEHVQRSKLRVDARKWLAAKLKPVKYGEKVQQEVTGKDGGPVESKWTVEFVNATPESKPKT